jgi:hypothetical protein
MPYQHNTPVNISSDSVKSLIEASITIPMLDSELETKKSLHRRMLKLWYDGAVYPLRGRIGQCKYRQT